MPVRRSAGVCETQVKISIVSSQRERPAHRCAAAIIARAASSASASGSMSSYDTRRVVPPDVASPASFPPAVSSPAASSPSPFVPSLATDSNARRCSGVRPNLPLISPRASTPRLSSHSTQSHSGMSVTVASTRYTCGDLTNEIILAGVRSEPRKCRPRRLYPRGNSCREGSPVTPYESAATRCASTSSLAIFTRGSAEKCAPISW
mmetsp:Transcript_697/g.2642  ORF Transcript_697/g.2642 Transcript_697/m.2642 type:complete len:206 (-) Transcript_697:779-1396(-)